MPSTTVYLLLCHPQGKRKTLDVVEKRRQNCILQGMPYCASFDFHKNSRNSPTYFSVNVCDFIALHVVVTIVSHLRKIPLLSFNLNSFCRKSKIVMAWNIFPFTFSDRQCTYLEPTLEKVGRKPSNFTSAF